MSGAASLLRELKSRGDINNAAKAARELRIQQLEAQGTLISRRLEQVPAGTMERSHLQNQLMAVEQSIRAMAVHKLNDDEQALFGSEADQVAKFSQSVKEYLRNYAGRRCFLSQIGEDPKVQREMLELKRCRIVRKSADFREILNQKCPLFEVALDAQKRGVLRFKGDTGTEVQEVLVPSLMGIPVGASGYFPGGYPGCIPQPAIAGPGMGSMGMAMLTHAAGYAPGMQTMVPTPPGSAQQQPQLLALTSPTAPGAAGSSAGPPGAAQACLPIGMELSKEKVALVELELAKAGGSDRARKLCLHLNLQEPQLMRHFRFVERSGKTYVEHQLPDISELEAKLLTLRPHRADVFEVMAFCLDRAAQYAVPLARALARSLEVPDVETEVRLARLYVVSDVLYNARSATARGAARFRTAFEELLPDAFDALGRQWSRGGAGGGGAGHLERSRVASIAGAVLQAWRGWDVFSAVFVSGLEALVLSPTPDGAVDDAEGADAVLRQKLQQWKVEATEADVPTAARRRGLSGPVGSLPAAECRQRLCRYERYWHRDRVDPKAEFRRVKEADEEELGSIDGESLSDGDLEYMAAMRDAGRSG
eukprot:TRINITY_DN13529_c0_g1_i1.p1 TRINITY_DN13529_c0_g1~~TRINITY_DN13529_c0_g1_i1.p1  ORF type:complete len:593 (-),score=167.38 TRINITY_DN13529_c0_g1_i1:12-1790(-)